MAPLNLMGRPVIGLTAVPLKRPDVLLSVALRSLALVTLLLAAIVTEVERSLERFPPVRVMTPSLKLRMGILLAGRSNSEARTSTCSVKASGKKRSVVRDLAQ